MLNFIAVSNHGCHTKIRIWSKRVKISCATITLCDKKMAEGEGLELSRVFQATAGFQDRLFTS